jgi:hypothetical protein
MPGFNSWEDQNISFLHSIQTSYGTHLTSDGMAKRDTQACSFIKVALYGTADYLE